MADIKVPMAALRKIRREDRKLAREVRNDAADACGMRRLQFMRALAAGDVDCNEQLRLSLIEHPDAGEWDIDVDKLKEILAMILDFIKQLLAIFGMFAV